MKYIKKPVEPVVIEAFRMGIDPRPDWFTEAVTHCRITTYTDDSNTNPFEFVKTYCIIDTLDGKIKCDYGDYIVHEVDGDIYPVKSDIFNQTYTTIDNIIASNGLASTGE